MPLRGDAVVPPACCFYLDRPTLQHLLPDSVSSTTISRFSAPQHLPASDPRESEGCANNDTTEKPNLEDSGIFPLLCASFISLSSTLNEFFTLWCMDFGFKGRKTIWLLAGTSFAFTQWFYIYFILCNASIKALIVEDLLWSLIDRVCARSLKTEL